MRKEGTIVVIDDDPDDLETINEALISLNINNKTLFFHEANIFLDFINKKHEPIFLILCDIHMPKINGLDLYDQLCSESAFALNCVPLIFLTTTTTSPKHFLRIYSSSVKGCFNKPASFEELKVLLKCIIAYWDKAS